MDKDILMHTRTYYMEIFWYSDVQLNYLDGFLDFGVVKMLILGRNFFTYLY